MINRKTVESTYPNLVGYIEVPLWLTPEDVSRWNDVRTSPTPDGDDNHFIVSMYAPFVRTWKLTFKYPGGSIEINDIEVVESFGKEPPNALANLIVAGVRPVVEALFLAVEQQEPSLNTGTETA